MPHADSSLVPEEITTKAAFYDHVFESIQALISGHTYWVSNLSNASSLLYHCYLSTPLYGLSETNEPIVNWCGFYLHPPSHPSPNLLLGPFNGRPACQYIVPSPGRGVCADGFVSGVTVVVDDVEAYPGHIACDGASKSEIVVPLRDKEGKVVGVLDLDSTRLRTFDLEDVKGLERVMDLLRI